MKNIHIIIENSGLLEKYGCTVEDILHSYSLYIQGFCFPEHKGKEPDIHFLEMLQKMSGPLDEINDMLRRQIMNTHRYMIECEIKKANGTFDEWQAELSALGPFVKLFLSEFSKIIPPISTPNRLN